MTMTAAVCLRRIRFLISVVIIGLVISGATAIPLTWELNLLASWLPQPGSGEPQWLTAFTHWIFKVRDGLSDTDSRYPFLAYGTDWLAFGHFAIAIVFIGPLRDPVRNIWVINFGLIVSALIVPYALIFGEMRGIPIFWRFIDCCFGLFAIPLLWIARSDAHRLEALLSQTG